MIIRRNVCHRYATQAEHKQSCMTHLYNSGLYDQDKALRMKHIQTCTGKNTSISYNVSRTYLESQQYIEDAIHSPVFFVFNYLRCNSGMLWFYFMGGVLVMPVLQYLWKYVRSHISSKTCRYNQHTIWNKPSQFNHVYNFSTCYLSTKLENASKYIT